MLFSMVICIALLASPAQPSKELDAENERLSGKAFRLGLKKLGLTDLLDLYVREFPPQDAVEAALLKRELRLNLYSDSTVPTPERLAALGEATQVLRDLLREQPDHEDHAKWQLELGQDLVDRQAEPYRNNILLRGGTAADRQRLGQLSAEALAVYDRLIAELRAAEAGIDQLSIGEFEKSVRTGEIERIEALLPRARYFRLWASYYQCLSMPSSGDDQQKALTEIITELTEDLKLTRLDHEQTHAQAQALLLAGMTYRMLGSQDRAEDALLRAIEVSSKVPDFAERHNLRWVVNTATLERIRSFRDMGDHQSALQVLDDYRRQLVASAAGSFALEFALALLEGTIYRAEAQELGTDQAIRRDELLFKSRQPLIHLARQHPLFEDEIYSELYKLLGGLEDLHKLDAFEKSVLIAGLLRQVRELKGQPAAAGLATSRTDVQRAEEQKQRLLERAVEAASSLIADESELAAELRPEALFNLAVCRHEQGKVLEAIEQFSRLVREYPGFGRSQVAAEYAVRLAERTYQAAANQQGQRAAARQLYIQVLSELMAQFRDSPEARSRRYTYSRLLQEDGDYREAARQFALIPADAPEYAEALFRSAECEFSILRQLNAESELSQLEAQSTVVLNALQRLNEQAGLEQDGTIAVRTAEARLIEAETELIRPTASPQRALEAVKDFEVWFPQQPDLLGRALRIRILAYQKQGSLDQATALIPAYLERDPVHAGPVLQDLLKTFNGEIAEARRRERPEEARLRAQDALLVARALRRWATSRAELPAPTRRTIDLEYGEALLAAADYDSARALFEELRTAEAGRDHGPGIDGRVVYGLARAHSARGEHAQALQQYNQLFQNSRENSELWWRGFVGEIESRRALDQAPEILYNLISQKRVFFPELGGAEIRQELTRLQTELAPKR